MILKADFHIHSCLSPCGDLDMSPTAIAEHLAQKNVQIAALTDHNSSLNCPAFEKTCTRNGIFPLFGMELQTIEEVHILCLFADTQSALDFGSEMYQIMPAVMNIPEKMGDQIYVDENEDIIGEVEKYLVTSADLSIDQAAARVHQLGGIVIPAHVDRPAFSLSSQLGFIPDGDWDALEVIRIPSSENTLGYPLTTSSDAHYLEHIARRPFTLDLENIASIEELFALKTDTPNGTKSVTEAIKKALIKRPR